MLTFNVARELVITDLKDLLISTYSCVENVISTPTEILVVTDSASTQDEEDITELVNQFIYSKTIESIVNNAIQFGNAVIVEFAAENIALGITQAGMTGPVRQATSEVVSALQTGSLYDAIAECKAIPAENKDSTFITDTRLLSFVNKIEEYLGITLSTDLN